MVKWIWLGVCLFCTNGFSEPVAKVTAKVVDEAGVPIKDAKVSFVFNMYQDEEATHTGTTDTNGVFTIEGETTMHIYVAAEKEGYYKSGENYYFKERNEAGTRYEPWGVEQTLTLRSIIDPKEGKSASTRLSVASWAEIPTYDKPVGFDLLKSDWVAPYGKGEIADFIFTFSKDTDKKTMSYVLTFSSEGDGIVEYPFDKNGQSTFRWPYEAPIDGYLASMKRSLIYERSSAVITDEEEMKEDTQINYIFRVRTKYDKQGNLESALYGKIAGELGMWPRPRNELRFEYWLNTDPHSRSLESMDPNSP